jgi:hypothetical protein
MTANNGTHNYWALRPPPSPNYILLLDCDSESVAIALNRNVSLRQGFMLERMFRCGIDGFEKAKSTVHGFVTFTDQNQVHDSEPHPSIRDAEDA